MDYSPRTLLTSTSTVLAEKSFKIARVVSHPKERRHAENDGALFLNDSLERHFGVKAARQHDAPADVQDGREKRE
jgi:hypothetical protein